MLKKTQCPDNWRDLPSHRFANIFPLVSTDKLQETLPTMWSIGYDDDCPVVLYRGKILDGRNRLRAAIQAGRTPTFQEFIGSEDEALAFVSIRNKDRRHLTTGQWASAGSKLEEIYKEWGRKRKQEGGREGGVRSGSTRRGETKDEETFPHPSSEAPEHRDPQARDKAAAELSGGGRKVSGRTIGEFKRIQEQAPDLAEKVEAGEMDIWAASDELKRRLGTLKPKEQLSPAIAEAVGAVESPSTENFLERQRREMAEARAAAKKTNDIIERHFQECKEGIDPPRPDFPHEMILRGSGEAIFQSYSSKPDDLVIVLHTAARKLPMEQLKVLLDLLAKEI